MTDVSFYHLQRSSLESVLPKLLERTLAGGKRAVVMAGSDARVRALNGLLWTYDPASWLPHGSAAEGDGADHPVWLTTSDENPNAATYLFLTDGAEPSKIDGFERCFDLFDGNDPTSLAAARGRWKACQDAGHALTYWQQSPEGRWEEKKG